MSFLPSLRASSSTLHQAVASSSRSAVILDVNASRTNLRTLNSIQRRSFHPVLPHQPEMNQSAHSAARHRPSTFWANLFSRRTTATSGPAAHLPKPPRAHASTTSVRSASSTSTLGGTSGPGAGYSGSSGSTGGSTGGGSGAKKPSPHLVWYREIVPAMVPILLLSTTLFLGLSLLRTHLSHNLSLTESNARISELEAELDRLRRDRHRLRERERKERERIVPIVVGRVLQRVGAMKKDQEEEEEALLAEEEETQRGILRV